VIQLTITQLHPVTTKTFKRKGITDEIARRAKPKAARGKARSWVFGGMTGADLQSVLDGNVVTVSFNSGRTVHVGLG
jgi:hypothetical protein